MCEYLLCTFIMLIITTILSMRVGFVMWFLSLQISFLLLILGFANCNCLSLDASTTTPSNSKSASALGLSCKRPLLVKLRRMASDLFKGIMTLELEPYQSQNLLARVGKSFMVQGLVVSSMAGIRKWSGE